jgi:hypothetical protein
MHTIARKSPAGPGRRVRLGALCLVFAALGLPACTSIELGLGLRTRLDTVPVTAVQVALVPGPALAPGASVQLVLTAVTADARKLVTEGPGQGTVLYDSYSFTGSVAQVSAQGVVTLAADPRLSDGRTPHVHVAVNGHPGLVADIDIPVHYNVGYKADFSGHAGSPGFNGADGMAGMSGSPGSLDPDAPSPGGNGSAGGDGGDGQDGGPGEDGKAVQVWVTRKPEPYLLLQIRVASAGSEQLFLLDPAGGTLDISANGGPGGAGGAGGRGGMGGSGGMGTPSGASGANGMDGRRGSDGGGGAAGSIAIVVDPRAQAFLDRIRLSNRSGDGAPGPAPSVSVQAVAPLW